MCTLDKQTRQKIPKVWTSSTTRILQLVHSDVYGPFITKSLGGTKFFVTFIDDFLKMSFVYFLTHKSKTFEKFVQFHQTVERQIGQKLFTLRTSNGGEFLSREFQEYCTLKGIKRQLSQLYTPHQNGVAERKNCSILDITRCFLLEQAVPKFL